MAGTFALLGGLVLASATSAGAATGGTVTDSITPIQAPIGTVTSDGNPVWLVDSNGNFEGGEIVTCNDSYCRDSSIAVVDGLYQASGFDVADNGRAVIVGSFFNDDDVPEPRIVVCSDTTCDRVVSNTPAPALGETLIRTNGSMVIIDDTNITRCRNLDCTGNVRVRAHGVADFVDVTLDRNTPVFLTDDAIVRCSRILCQGAETSTSIDVDADGIVIRSNNRATLSVRTGLGDGSVAFELHHCLNARCTNVDVEPLDFSDSSRADFTLFDSGDPIVGTRNIIALSRDTTLLASSAQRCAATAAGNNVNLSFDGDIADAAILRVNGRFVANVTGQDSFTVSAGDEAIIRSWTDGEFVDVPCV